MNRFVYQFFSVILILLISSSAFAFVPASTYVELSDPAYAQIEKLAAFGLCDVPMLDQRPFTRAEFARLTSQALARRKNLKPPDDADYKAFSRQIAKHRHIDEVIAALTEKFEEELIQNGAREGKRHAVLGHGLEELRLEGVYLSSSPLVVMPANGIGGVNAVVNPLMHYREGRHAVFGAQEAWETVHRLGLTEYFSVLAHPRFEANMWRSDFQQSYMMIYLQEGYGQVKAGPVALTLGRSSIVWGPGENGSLMLSNNARPLDQVQISTPSPFRLPSVLRRLGQWKLAVFGANLGPEQVRRYDWLTGYRISYLPAKYVEIGFGHTVQMGGEGSPPFSAIDILGEFIGFRPAGSANTDVNKTNHFMEGSLLVRVPQLFGLKLYGVLHSDDKRDTFKRFLRDGCSYLAGFHLPRVFPSGRGSVRFEFKRMGPTEYRHGLYTDGYTLDTLFIGDDLGSDALGTHFRYSHDISRRLTLAGRFDWDLRRDDMHATVLDPDGTLGDTIVTVPGNAEQRFRFVIEPKFTAWKNVGIAVSAGYERVLNSGYTMGLARNNWLAALFLRINLDKHFSFEAE